MVNTRPNEKYTENLCIVDQSSHDGNTLWEERYPGVTEILYKLAVSHAQQGLNFITEVAFTLLPPEKEPKQLSVQIFQTGNIDALS